MDSYERAVAALSMSDPNHLLSSTSGNLLVSDISNLSNDSKSKMQTLHSNSSPKTVPTKSETSPSGVDLSKHPSGLVPDLQNVVSTCCFGCQLDLKKIAQHARNAEFNPKRFAAVIMRIREPKTTALIFSSGKMVCTGAKSEQDSRLASRKYAKIVMKLGYNVTFQDFKIQNIVGSCDVQFPIRLESFHMKHRLFSRYEPELFPGLIYKMKVPKVVLLVFVSGKVVLTGAKTRNEIYQAFENIYPALTEFRKGRLASSSRSIPKEETHGRLLPSLSTQLVAESPFSGERRLETESKSMNKMSPSRGMTSISQAFRSDSKPLQVQRSLENRPSRQTDSFYSRSSPFNSNLRMVTSSEIGFNLQHLQQQQQRTTPMSPLASCPPATPGFNLPPPPPTP